MASLLLFLLSSLQASHSCVNGFSLELIPPFSPESPLFKITKRRGEQISSHASIGSVAPPLSSEPSINASHVVTPPIQQLFESSFVVQVGLGTFDVKSPSASSRKSYYFILDTGSSLTWTQCEDCKLPGNSCYRQKEQVFPNYKSKSYDPLPCNKHPLCKPNKCIGNHCSYSVKYVDGAYSSGILAKETFSFPSTSTSQTEAVPGVVFGCGIKNTDPKESADYDIAGVFGLGQGDRSFVKQIQKHSDGKFSYCLTNIMQTHNQNPPPRMYLRFGADIKPPTDPRTINFFKNGRYEAYFVRLLDLGVNGEPLGIDPRVFQVGADGKGGCVVDSGSSHSYVIEEAYKMLERKMKQYFSRLPEFERYRGGEGKVCYRRRNVEGFSKIPGVNWYFEGARMDVSGEGTFRREERGGKEVFCMMIEADQSMTTLGAFQQVNHKFVFDTLSNKLHFGPQDCATNG
ncbi:aspartic proteinase nepenthesin-2-like [Prosopis cineraria]|uniref:aspartic proteinase nepenthesin-2-like n=1 Tax=Prosopis cineraria TaxID=364024 RepID=UPI00240FF247|nr:aspartic proteinase nepenthesin-2-like [Prosopis cineraria]